MKLIYDVSTQIVVRESAYMVFERLLRTLTDMPQTLEECTRSITLTQKKPATERWQTVANIRRQQTLHIVDSEEKQAVDHYLAKEREFKAAYPDTWQARDEVEGRNKQQREEELKGVRDAVNIAMVTKRKEASKIDGQYSDQEEKEARG